MKNAEFRKIVGTVNYSLTLPGRSAPFSFQNVNRLLETADWVTGIKTGSTDDAQFCLVASGSRDGASAISVVLGESNWTNTWADSERLLNYGFRREQMPDAPSGMSLEGYSSVESVSLNESSMVVARATTPCRTDDSISLVTAGSGTIAVTVPAGAKIAEAVELPKTLSTPIQQGEILGQLVYTANGKTLASLNIVASQTIPRPSLATRMKYCCDWLGHKIAASF
jgi:D-alanyl-D-alanine carboxypeptidase (penicillin-binding protein 5/6)